MMHVQIKELSPDAFQREALKLANNVIGKSLHYIPEADIEVYNIDFEAFNVTALSDTDGDHVYLVFADDNKVIRTMHFYQHEFMDLIIR